MHSIARVATVVALTTLALPVLADVDPESFPKELRALEWREIGPYRGGRSAAVTGLPANEDTYYMGTTGGGVWKTLDAGQSWKNVSDGYFIPPKEAYLQVLYDDPGFAPIRASQEARQRRERDRFLDIVCTDNPYATVWQPEEGTCEQFAATIGN